MCGPLHNWGKNLSREVFSPGTDAGIGDAKKFVPSLDDHGFVGPDLKGSGQDRADRRKGHRPDFSSTSDQFTNRFAALTYLTNDCRCLQLCRPVEVEVVLTSFFES